MVCCTRYRARLPGRHGVNVVEKRIRYVGIDKAKRESLNEGNNDDGQLAVYHDANGESLQLSVARC